MINHNRKKELNALMKRAGLIIQGNESIRALAEVLECTPQNIYTAINKGVIPPRMAKKIHTLTHGIVSKELLNPEIFG